MQDERINPTGPEKRTQDPNRDAERFESDTQKLVRRHMEDPDHVISDEEIESLRVGMTPPNAGEGMSEQLDNDKSVEEAEKKLLGTDDNGKESQEHPHRRITPWDTIEPE